MKRYELSRQSDLWECTVKDIRASFTEVDEYRMEQLWDNLRDGNGDKLTFNNSTELLIAKDMFIRGYVVANTQAPEYPYELIDSKTHELLKTAPYNRFKDRIRANPGSFYIKYPGKLESERTLDRKRMCEKYEKKCIPEDTK